jgi:cbb3-type cytochrome oxidase subunit 3
MDTGPVWAWLMWMLSVVLMLVGFVAFAWWLDRMQERHAAKRRALNESQDARDEQ